MASSRAASAVSYAPSWAPEVSEYEWLPQARLRHENDDDPVPSEDPDDKGPINVFRLAQTAYWIEESELDIDWNKILGSDSLGNHIYEEKYLGFMDVVVKISWGYDVSTHPFKG